MKADLFGRVLDRFRASLGKWRVDSLNFSGKLVLAKHYFSPIPVYLGMGGLVLRDLGCLNQALLPESLLHG